MLGSYNTQNQFDENIVVVGLTTDEMERIRIFEVFIKNTKETGLDESSKICCNYLHTINKKLRLVDKQRIGVVNLEIMAKVKKALRVVLSLGKELSELYDLTQIPTRILKEEFSEERKLTRVK